MLPGLINAFRQLDRGIAQAGELGVTSAHAACAEVSSKTPAHLPRPPDAEPLLKRLVIISAGGAQKSPEPKPHVIQRTLEVLQPFHWRLPPGQPALDCGQGRIKNHDLLEQAGLRHRSSTVQVSDIEHAFSRNP
jgi:hypothetical protein